MDIIVRADIEHILDNIISVCVLHELQGLLHDTVHQVGSGFTHRRVQTSLDNAATMAMTCDVPDACSNGIKHKLGVLWSKLQEDALDDVVAVTVNA